MGSRCGGFPAEPCPASWREIGTAVSLACAALNPLYAVEVVLLRASYVKCAGSWREG
jgi:hypothetical protein